MAGKKLKRIVALFLIISMTFGNTAFVGKAFATSIIIELLGQNDNSNGTGHENIEFDVYFEDGNEHSRSVERDVNGYDANLELELGVKNIGYLKNANVEIYGEDGEELNFDVSKTRKEIEVVEKTEDENSQVISINGENKPHDSQITLDLNADNRKDSEQDQSALSPIVVDLEDTEKTDLPAISIELNDTSENGDEASEKETIKVVTEKDVVEEYQDYIDSIADSRIVLKQINATTNVKLSIPLEYRNEKFIKESKLNDNAIVKLTGKYVDQNGDEHNIEKSYTINLKWSGKRNISVSSEVVKHIDFGSGIIIQSLVRVDNSSIQYNVEQTENNAELFNNMVPVKETNLQVKVPTYMEKEPNNISVSATKLEATNGQCAENIAFGEENWSYDRDSKELNIKVENKPQSMIYSENENGIYDANSRKEEDRIYNIPGIDEYLITYTYLDVKASEEGTIFEDSINVNQKYYGGNDSNSISNGNFEENKELKEQTGNLISLDSGLETEKISKKYGYLNYRNDEKVEKEIISTDAINVSYKDIVESINLKDIGAKYIFENKETKTDDIYYKEIILSRTNFEDILGENGNIQVYDENKNQILMINKDSWRNDDIAEFLIDGQRRIEIVTSKPEKEGVLMIKKVRAIRDNTISRDEFIASKVIKFEEEINAKYQFVENDVNVGMVDYELALENTSTKVNVNMNKSTLSTLSNNEDVIFEIRLNNNDESSDIYGKSHFEITVPMYISNLEIKDKNIISGAGLEIDNVVYEDHKIKADLKGMQNSLNNGNPNNGTIIMINTNVDVDDYTPAVEDYIRLTCSNEEATSYANNNVSYTKINYSSPTGVVTINDIRDYVDNGFVTSVRQGLKEDFINAHSTSRQATMGLTVINNNKNEISDLKIVGRFPFKGVKDPVIGEDMGITISASSKTQLAESESNSQKFKIYYSEREDATSDTENEANGWNENLDIEKAKSYLIMPIDENFVMQPFETLRFTYMFEIPEDIGREEYIGGTFWAEYKNNSEIGVFEEKSCPDIVRLTTGTGPELELLEEDNNEELYNNSDFAIKVKVNNVGKEEANNVKIKVSNLYYVDYRKFESEQDDIVKLEDSSDEALLFSVDKLDIKKNVEITIWFRVNPSKTSKESSQIEFEILAEADDLGEIIYKKTNPRIISNPELTIKEEYSASMKKEYYYEDEEIETVTVIGSYVKEPVENVYVEKYISKEFEVVSSTLEVLGARSSDFQTVGSPNYDEETGKISITIDKIERSEAYYLRTTLKTKEVPSSYDYVTGKISSKIKASTTKEYTSNEFEIRIAKVKIEITQLTEVKDDYIRVGDPIEYKFSIKNVGVIDANRIIFNDQMPKGVRIDEATYTKDGLNYNNAFVGDDKASITLTLAASEEAIVNIDAIASTTNGSIENTAINSGSVKGEKFDEISSKSVLYVIRARDEDLMEDDYSSFEEDEDRSGIPEGVTSYNNKISGKVWFDSNGNGEIDSGENINEDFKSIVINLLDVESGDIIKTTKIGNLGEYRFSGVPNGKYVVLFEYNTMRYGITTYKKSGVSEELNSDAYSGNISKNNKSIKVAMTDELTINNSDAKSINLGLANASKFDLEITMGISKITVQNEAGTKTTNYKNVSFAKEEISAKYVAGSKVLIEYKIRVKNSGDVEGFVKKIIDYVPEGMEFNSSYKGNENWYTSNDGNIFSNAFEKTELKPGQTSDEITLVLSKKMSEENTGMISNQVEIYEDYNVHGISDADSKAGNNIQREDDLSIADVLILLKTGEEFIMTSVIVTMLTLGGIIAFVIYKSTVYTRKKRR